MLVQNQRRGPFLNKNPGDNKLKNKQNIFQFNIQYIHYTVLHQKPKKFGILPYYTVTRGTANMHLHNQPILLNNLEKPRGCFENILLL